MTKYGIKKIAFNREKTDNIRALSYALSFSALYSLPIVSITVG